MSNEQFMNKGSIEIKSGVTLRRGRSIMCVSYVCLNLLFHCSSLLLIVQDALGLLQFRRQSFMMGSSMAANERKGYRAQEQARLTAHGADRLLDHLAARDAENDVPACSEHQRFPLQACAAAALEEQLLRLVEGPVHRHICWIIGQLSLVMVHSFGVCHCG